MPTKHRGRPRTLNSRKKTQICDLVAGGAQLAEAAVAVGVSTRTIHRECRWDAKFDQELRLAQGTPADPLKLMQQAARTHWRAAAWLLERENPERYGRRKASSCSPKQLDQALRAVIEAALKFAPPPVRGELFDHLEAAGEAAFKTAFPLVNEWGGRREPQRPETPLADREKLTQICEGRRCTQVDESAMADSRAPEMPKEKTRAGDGDAPARHADSDLNPKPNGTPNPNRTTPNRTPPSAPFPDPFLSLETRFATKPPGDNNFSPSKRSPHFDPPADTTGATGPARPNPASDPPASAA